MLMLGADAAYADQLERALYNGLLPHYGLDDRSWFYLCPMASDGDHPRRNAWGNPATGCCGANAVRFMPSVPSYMFTTSDDGVWVHLYDACRMDWHLPDGSPISLDVRTRYPWSGGVEVRVGVDEPSDFTVHLRIPGWCDDAQAAVNGEPVADPITRGSYLALRRTWTDGDVIALDLPMPVVGMEADPRAGGIPKARPPSCAGRCSTASRAIDNIATSVRDLAVEPGEAIRPFVSDSEPQALYQPAATVAAFVPVDQPDLLGGVTVLQGPAAGRDAGTELTAVPFYAWSNREATPMAVWIDWADGEVRQAR